MQAKTSIAALALVATIGAGAAAVAAPTADRSEAGVPRVQQMVVFRGGALTRKPVLAKRTTVKLGRRTCAVAAATPLAALLRAKPGRIGFHDYGSCSRNPADSSGLFVKALRGQVNRAQNGWVYKVGRKLGTAGAADPAGPFGDGRLRAGDEVVWFYCVFDEGSCQHSLEIEARALDGQAVEVTVKGYDDSGEGTAVKGARVVVKQGKATVANGHTDSAGRAALAIPGTGRFTLHAASKSTIRAFPRSVTVD
jgi:hypothetical protein